MTEVEWIEPGATSPISVTRKGHAAMYLFSSIHGKRKQISGEARCAFNQYHMGITAENVAAKFGIDRHFSQNSWYCFCVS